MTSARPRRLAIQALVLSLTFSFSIACSGGLPLPVASPSPAASPAASPTVSLETPVVSAAVATLPAADTPSATVAPSQPTQPPAPTSTPVPAGGIEFKPAELAQGGYAIVYLNEAASAATLSFGGKQYPMLKSGDRWWAIVGIGAFAQPGLAPATVAYIPEGKQKQESITKSIPIVARDFPVEHITLDSQTASLLAPDIVNNEIAQRAAIFSGYTMQRLWSGPFVAPGRGEITSIYGEGRSYNDGPVTDYHRGTDFPGSIGDPVRVAASGKVVFADALKVRGNTIVVDHGAGLFTAYHHLSAFEVKAGDMVTAGQEIGKIGSTGLVTGPHLHWEVIIRGIEVDGRLFLTGQEIGP